MPALGDVVDPIPAGAGPVGLFSSDEFTPAARAFDAALLAAARGPRVALILDADPANAPRNAREAAAHFAALGARVEPDPSRTDAHGEPGPPRAGAEPDPTSTAAEPDPEAAPDVYYLGGGDPRTLLASLHGTERWRAILDAWRAGAALAGSSAGAMALCTACLVAREGDDKPTRWTEGLGPLARVGLAVHATTRPASWLRSVAEISRLPVVAIDDATGVLLRHGEPPSVIGGGDAWIVEP